MAIRVPRLRLSIWFDEWCRTHQWLSPDNVGRILLMDVHNPLYNALMFGWINALGDSPLSIRAPSLIAGAWLIVTLWRWARDRVGEPIAWLAAGWLVVSPAHVWYSTEAKNTMFLVAVTTQAVVALDRLTLRPDRIRLATATLWLVLALATDWLALLALVPALATLLISCGRARDRSAFRALAHASLLAALAGLPWAVHKVLHAGSLWRDYLDPFTLFAIWEFVVLVVPTGRAIFRSGQQGLLMMLVLTPFVLGLVVMGWRRLAQLPRGHVIASCALGPVALWFIAAQILQWSSGFDPTRFIYQPRNLLVALPWFALLLCSGALALPNVHLRRAAMVTLLGLGLAGTLLMTSVHRSKRTLAQPPHDWKQLAHQVAGAIGDGDGPRSLAIVSNSLAQPLGYYLGRARIDAPCVTGDRPRWDLGELDRRVRAGDRRVLLVLIADLHPITPQERAELFGRFELTEVGRIEGVECFWVQPSPPVPSAGAGVEPQEADPPR